MTPFVNLICCFGRPARSNDSHATKDAVPSPPAALSGHSERLSQDISRSCDALKANVTSTRSSIDKCVDTFKKEVNDTIQSFCSTIVDEIKNAVCHEKEHSIEVDELRKKITELQLQKDDIQHHYTLLVTGSASNESRLSMDARRLLTTTPTGHSV